MMPDSASNALIDDQQRPLNHKQISYKVIAVNMLHELSDSPIMTFLPLLIIMSTGKNSNVFEPRTPLILIHLHTPMKKQKNLQKTLINLFKPLQKIVSISLLGNQKCFLYQWKFYWKFEIITDFEDCGNKAEISSSRGN